MEEAPAVAVAAAAPVSLDALAGAAGVLAALAALLGVRRLCARCARAQQRALRDDGGFHPSYPYHHPLRDRRLAVPLLSSGLPSGSGQR